MKLEDNLDKIRELMLDDLDLALQLIKGQGWDLKEVLGRIHYKYKDKDGFGCDDIKYCRNSIMNIYVYEMYSSVWYEDENKKVSTISSAIDFIINELIKDNKWNI